MRLISEKTNRQVTLHFRLSARTAIIICRVCGSNIGEVPETALVSNQTTPDCPVEDYVVRVLAEHTNNSCPSVSRKQASGHEL